MIKSIFRLQSIIIKPEIDSYNQKFNWVFTIFSGWIVFGHYFDLWAHLNKLTTNESFLNPWHGFLYLGVTALGIFMISYIAACFRKNTGLPVGYNLSLLGVFVLGVAGITDFFWHSFLGIEKGLELFVSPPHVLITIGDFLIFSGPLRNYLNSNLHSSKNLIIKLPALISISFILSIFTYMTLYTHPFVYTYATGTYFNTAFLNHDRAIYFIFLHVIILMGIVFYSIRLGNLPFGSFTIIYTLNAFLMAILRGNYAFVMGVFLSGLLTDTLYWMLNNNKSFRLRLFGFLVPVFYIGSYFLILKAIYSFNWSLHMWLGVLVVSGIIGIMISYLVATPYNNRYLSQ